MNKEKQKLECEMAEMLEIIEKAREIYANDITDHTENEYIREGLLDAGYRKQSENLVEVVRCYDCKYCEVVVDSIIDEPKYFCTRMVGSMPIDPTDYCSRAKMKGGAE